MRSGLWRSLARWSAAVALAVALAPSTARAAACCLSAGVFGVGRLVVWEESAVGTSVSATSAKGVWDADGRFRSWSSDYQEVEYSAELYGLLRLSDRFSGYARLPWVATSRSAGDQAELGHGLGDVQAGLRYEPLQIGEYEELPALSLTFSVLAPTGVRPEDTGTSFGTGTSGRGVWAGSLAVGVEQVWAPWFLRLDVGGSASLPLRRADLGVEQAYGPTLQAGVFGGRELLEDTWVLALGVIQEWEAPLSIDGAVVPGSAARSPTVTLSTSWKLSPHWMVQATGLANPWVDGLGTNRLGRFGGSLGVRYGHF